MKPTHMMIAAAAAFVLFRLYSANAGKDTVIAQLQRQLKKRRAAGPGTDDADDE